MTDLDDPGDRLRPTGAELIGRDDDLERIVAALADDRPVIVLGEVGIGKTALARVAIVRAGRPALEGGAFATLSWMPYFALERALGRRLSGDTAWVADAVERAVGPDILFVDDVQWADPGTVDVLVRLCGRVAVILAIRTGTDAGEHALRAFEGADPVLVRLGPLSEDGAARLVASRRPTLPADQARTIAALGAGNPFALEQLAEGGDPSADLRRAISVRLDQLDAGHLDALMILAVSDRPLPADRLPWAADLITAGMAVLTADGVAVRHALIADAVLARLDPETRSAVHRRVAGLVEPPGERARHLAAAGDTREAHALALRAVKEATTPGERGAHLRLASATADGPDADGLRIQAAAALRVAGDLDGARTAIASVTSEDPELRALAAAVRARIAWSEGDPDAMRAAIDAGLALVGGRGTPAEAMLRAERVTITALVDGAFDQGLSDAEQAIELARHAGADPTRALLLRATILTGLGRSGWADALEAVIDAARAAGDTETELSAANNLVTGHEMHGRPADGRRLAATMAERATALRLTGWARQFEALLASLDLHAGALEVALARSEALLEGELDPLATQQVGLTAALALVDLGRSDEAHPLLERLLATAAPDVTGRGDVLFVQAEAALWGGRPTEALGRIEAYADYASSEYPTSFLVDVTAAWAALDAGRPIPASLAHGEASGMLVGASVEREAIVELAAGRIEAAASLFARSAAAYTGFHRRGELRAAWAEGDARRRAGDEPLARAILERAEAAADRDGFVPLLARVHRSLRQLGIRRTARRAAPAAARLSPREREIATLVGRGLTNGEIARRLGLGRPTVVRILSNAMAKHGVDSRAQLAAALGEPG